MAQKYKEDMECYIIKYDDKVTKSNIKVFNASDKELYFVKHHNLVLFAKKIANILNNNVEKNISIQYIVNSDDDYLFMCIEVTQTNNIILDQIIKSMKKQITFVFGIEEHEINFESVPCISGDHFRLYWYYLSEKIFIQKETLQYMVDSVKRECELHHTTSKIILFPKKLCFSPGFDEKAKTYLINRKFIPDNKKDNKIILGEDIMRYNILFNKEEDTILPFSKDFDIIIRNEKKDTYDYDITDEFYLDTFTNFFSKKPFDNKVNATRRLEKFLGRIIRIVNNTQIIIFKNSCNELFAVDNLKNFLKLHKGIYCNYIENGGPKKLNVFSPLKDNPDILTVGEIYFKPYFLEKDKPETKGIRILNLFNKYEAKIINKKVFDKNISILNNILTYIKINIAGNNEQNYNYILNWLATIIQVPIKKVSIPLILINNEECEVLNKFINTFLLNNVLGKLNTKHFTNINSIDENYKNLYQNLVISISDDQICNEDFIKNYNKLKKLTSLDSYHIYEDKNKVEVFIRLLFVMDDERVNKLNIKNCSVFKYYPHKQDENKKDNFFNYLSDEFDNKKVANYFFTYLANYKCNKKLYQVPKFKKQALNADFDNDFFSRLKRDENGEWQIENFENYHYKGPGNEKFIAIDNVTDLYKEDCEKYSNDILYNSSGKLGSKLYERLQIKPFRPRCKEDLYFGDKVIILKGTQVTSIKITDL
jgi:hypothetical protein